MEGGSRKSSISYYTYDLSNVSKYVKLLEEHKLSHLVYSGDVSSRSVISVHPSFSVGVNGEYALSEYHRLHKVSSLMSALSGASDKYLKNQQSGNQQSTGQQEMLSSGGQSTIPDESGQYPQAQSKLQSQSKSQSAINPVTEPEKLTAEELISSPIKSQEGVSSKAPIRPSSKDSLETQIEKGFETIQKPILPKAPETESESKSEPVALAKERHVKTSLNKNIVLKRSSINEKKLAKLDKIADAKNKGKSKRPDFLEKATVSQKYGEVQSKLGNLLASKTSKMDVTSIRDKMLQLTKHLFRSKSVSERERIKIELSVMRQLLETVKKVDSGKIKNTKSAIKSQIKNNLLTAIISKQNREFLNLYNDLLYEFKDTVRNFKRDYSPLLNKAQWYQIESKDEFNKKASKLNMVITNFQNNIISRCNSETEQLQKKHMLELTSYLNSSKTKKDSSGIKLRKEKINAYTSKMKILCGKFKKDISSIVETMKANYDGFSQFLILRTGQQTQQKEMNRKLNQSIHDKNEKFKEQTLTLKNKDVSKEKDNVKQSKGSKQQNVKEATKTKTDKTIVSSTVSKPELTEAEIKNIVNNILDMDEQTIMYYTYNHLKSTYRNYNKGTVTLDQVLAIARKKMAEEQGVPKRLINKYFA